MLPGEAAAAAGDGRPGRGRWRGRGGSRGRGRWRVLLRTPGRVFGVTVIAVFALMAIIGPYLYPASLPIDPGAIYASPSWAHPLGTDFEGTDILALIVTGARYVLLAAFIAAVVTLAIGTAAGLAAGYSPRSAGRPIMRVTDFVLAIPGFPLLIVLATIWSFGSPGQMGLVLVL